MNARPVALTDRIAGLDGLRAISIGLVLAAHLSGTRGYPRIPGWLVPLAVNGALGVSVFFVISGFLITTLLLRETNATGALDIKRFYVRRALRIFPAYYLFLLVVSALWICQAIRLAPGELLSAATYTRNFYRGGSWSTGHAWSLAIEEQFYLAWPWVVQWGGRRRSLWIAGTVVVVSPFVRCATWLQWPSLRPLVDQLTFTRLDSIMVGCLLALSWPNPRFHDAMRTFHRRGGTALSLAALVGSIYLRSYWNAWHVLIGHSVEALAAAICIHACITHPRSRVTRILEQAPIRYVGTLSYSLYLWQQLFLDRYSEFALCHFPLNLFCAIAAAVLSRTLCEQPFLRLKVRFEHGTSPKTHVAPRARVSLPVQ